jgi:hypothetical protein
MKKGALSLVAASALVLAAGAADASEVGFNKKPGEAEMSVVRSVYGDYLRSHPEARLETATALVDTGRIQTLFVRFVDKSHCDDSGCFTAGLRWLANGWRVVFERHVARLAVGSVPALSPHGEAADLVVNDREHWQWNGRAYMADAASLGGQATPVAPADKDVEAALMKTVAAAKSLRGLVSDAILAGQPVHYHQSTVDLGSRLGKGYVVAADGGACGVVIGCPNFVLVKGKDGLRAVGSTYSTGAVSVLATERNGGRDIAFADPQGYHTLRWDGAAYRDGETSYASTVTPVP